MNVEKILFGQDEDGDIYRYVIKGENISVSFCEIGASIMSLSVNDKYGNKRDVVLGLERLIDYRKNWPAFGSVIGRYANRISKARFELNGEKYILKKNISGGCIHSGYGYHYRRWNSNCYESDGKIHMIFELLSKDGDQGFPGELEIKVEYIVSEDKSLEINYYYVSDRDTAVNMTNHCYFNLDGHDSGKVFNHYVMINSSYVTQVDKKLMPTGQILDVKGSAFDFKEKRTIKENLEKSFKPFCYEKEYDINYVLDKSEGEYALAAVLESDNSKIGMRVFTDMPGMQFYTANAVGGIKGKDGVKYEKNPAVCFETQFYPDAVNIQSFPSPIIKGGEIIHKRTRFEFYISD